ncbi:MAG: gamma carbonic anhydrase family protein [Spirochaetia bacterium]|jgi:carbonic anhydrase/acetyltransferase-like protein (isoleucine patch superfamily)|nr:gamma carbonic anhydrase family protein [Spirochaetia bacterium]
MDIMSDKKKNEDFKTITYISPRASVTGEVSLGEEVSIWHNATLRGDLAPVLVGRGSNVQDGAVMHVARDLPCIVGEDVTIGHGAIVHGCRVADRCLIGMGAIILNGAEIGEESIVGAGALVTEGKKIPPRSLVLGNPARIVRAVKDSEIEKITKTALHYRDMAAAAAQEKLLSTAPSSDPSLDAQKEAGSRR